MTRTLSTVFAMALVLSFSLVTATPVTANTLNVPSVAYPTIQAAINAASSGDTIMVAAGTYHEAITIPSAKTGLTLLGAQAGIDARGAKGGDGWYQGRNVVGESAIDLGGARVDFAGGITIDGFTIKNVDRIELRGNDNTLRNNIIIGEATSGQIQVIWPLETTSDFTVERNWIKDTDWSGVHLAFGADGLEITDNLFTDIGYAAIQLGHDNLGHGHYANTTISGNQIRRTGSQAINIDGLSETGLTIESNIVEYAGLDYVLATGRGAIRLYSDLTYENTLIRGNQLTYSLTGITVRAGDADWTNVTIENNYIGHNEVGIFVEGDAGGFGFDYLVHFNAITCNTVNGFHNNRSEPFDVRNNWWGCNDGPSGEGPGSGDGVSEHVTYNPWLVLGLTADPPSVPSGGTSDIMADVATNSDDVDTGAQMPDGTPIRFATTSGSVSPEVSIGGSGVASTTLILGIDSATISARCPCYVCYELRDLPLSPAYVVGWETCSISRVRVLLPWIALLAAIIVAVSLLVLRYRQTKN